MSEVVRVQGPTTEEIERRFKSPIVVAARPVILGGLGLLSFVRRFSWTGVGAERLLELDGPLIFAANHASHADTSAILGTLPARIKRRTCVAAALDVFGPANNGEKRSLHAVRRECLQIIVAAGFHAFAFDRHGPPLRSLRTAVQLVRNGWSLLLYPEGTRSRTGELGPFKAGVGVLAKMTGQPVVPIHVSGGTTILPCGHTIPKSGRAIVQYGDPLTIEKGETLMGFTQRVQGRIRELGRVEIASAPAHSLVDRRRDPLSALPPR